MVCSYISLVTWLVDVSWCELVIFLHHRYEQIHKKLHGTPRYDSHSPFWPGSIWHYPPEGSWWSHQQPSLTEKKKQKWRHNSSHSPCAIIRKWNRVYIHLTIRHSSWWAQWILVAYHHWRHTSDVLLGSKSEKFGKENAGKMDRWPSPLMRNQCFHHGTYTQSTDRLAPNGPESTWELATFSTQITNDTPCGNDVTPRSSWNISR